MSNDIQQAFASPVTPRAWEPFYSSIQIPWQDLDPGCTVCLPCARDSFEAPTKPIIEVDGKPVI